MTIEQMWRLFLDAENETPGTILPGDEERDRYTFFCGAWALFQAMARQRFSNASITTMHGELAAFRNSVFEGEPHERRSN
jgi:hypothetical protein